MTVAGRDVGGTNRPRVSIGLPVYNGERYLRATLDSLLAQTFPDFELVISDNGSTDGTWDIVSEYAIRDPRIRPYRQERNLGGSANYRFVFEHSRGRYFKWAAHDDLLAQEWLARCVAALDADPGVVAAYTCVRSIDEQGAVTGRYDRWDASLKDGSPDLRVRFLDLINVQHRCFAIFGLVRADVLARTPLVPPYAGSDRNLLAELGLIGRFHRVPEYLFDYREHAGGSMTAYRTERDRVRWFDPDRQITIGFPVWRTLGEYIKSIRRVPLPNRDRLSCYLVLVRWPFGPTWYRQRWVFMLRDLVTAVPLAARRVVATARRRKA